MKVLILFTIFQNTHTHTHNKTSKNSKNKPHGIRSYSFPKLVSEHMEKGVPST